MPPSTLLLALLASTPAVAATELQPVPAEVQTFIEDRRACDHFRGEPVADEPRDPRRLWIEQSLEIHCAGTDRRLRALRQRYAGEPAILALLDEYEDRIESLPCPE